MSVFKVGSNKSSQNNFPSVRPTLDLDFANSKTLDPRITFTRASGGSYVGADGLIKLAGVNEPRFDHDPVTGESLGFLVEEARTNQAYPSIPPSSTSGRWEINGLNITTNAGTAPDGTNTASLINVAAGSGNNRAYVYSGTAQEKTYSFYAKASTSNAILGVSLQDFWNGGGNKLITYAFNTDTLTITGTQVNVVRQKVSNDWVRISITATPSSVIHYISFNQSAIGTGQYFLWGFQEELASFPTSYIPTTTATVTRAADSASITGKNFSSWYRQDEGTMFLNARHLSDLTSFGFYISNAGGEDNSHYIGRYQGNVYVATRLAGVTAINENLGAAPIGTSYKAILAYKQNSLAGSLNGSIRTSNSGSIPTSLTTAEIDNRTNGTIARLTYYPKRLTDAQLQALTR